MAEGIRCVVNLSRNVQPHLLQINYRVGKYEIIRAKSADQTGSTGVLGINFFWGYNFFHYKILYSTASGASPLLFSISPLSP